MLVTLRFLSRTSRRCKCYNNMYNIDVSHSDGYDVSLTAIAPLVNAQKLVTDYQWDLSNAWK